MQAQSLNSTHIQLLLFLVEVRLILFLIQSYQKCLPMCFRPGRMSDTVFPWPVCQCLVLGLVLRQSLKQRGGCHR